MFVSFLKYSFLRILFIAGSFIYLFFLAMDGFCNYIKIFLCTPTFHSALSNNERKQLILFSSYHSENHLFTYLFMMILRSSHNYLCLRTLAIFINPYSF